MFIVVIFSLAALAVAEPEFQQQIRLEQPVAPVQQQPIHHGQQQVGENPNAIPLYKQVSESTPVSEQNNQRFIPDYEEVQGRGIESPTYQTPLITGFREKSYFPYSEEMKEYYPSGLYNYKNVMTYPTRVNHFLRYLNKPEMRVSQPSNYLTPLSSGLKEQMYFPYSEETRGYYPSRPYNYKNFVTYPYRSSYFLRYLNKPETSVSQPKVDYDAQDIYHLHDVNHQHTVNNIHDFQQKHIIRKLDQGIDSPYLPHSPMYYNKLKMSNRGYPYGNNYYGKSLEQEHIQPWTNNYYNKYWDTDYIRNYYGNLNSEVPRPYMYRNWVEPLLYGKMNWDTEQPITSSEYSNIEYAQEAKNLDIDDTLAGAVYTLNKGYPYGSQQYRRSMEQDYVQPWFNMYVQPASIRSTKSHSDFGINYIHPIAPKTKNVNYIRPISTNSHNVDLEIDTSARSTVGLDRKDYIPITAKSQGPELFMATITENRNTEQMPIARPKRNLEAQAGPHGELHHETPLSGLRYTPAVSHTMEQHEVITPEHIPQEGRSQDIQQNTVKAEAGIQAEDHISQDPIHRQARDTTTQIVAPQYTFYPYYLYPYYRAYLPVQPAPLVTRSALYPYLPYYYDLLLRK